MLYDYIVSMYISYNDVIRLYNDVIRRRYLRTSAGGKDVEWLNDRLSSEPSSVATIATARAPTPCRWLPAVAAFSSSHIVLYAYHLSPVSAGGGGGGGGSGGKGSRSCPSARRRS